MAKFKSRRTRFLMRLSRRTGQGMKSVPGVERMIRNPAKSAVSVLGNRMVSWGSGPMRQGPVRNRFQVLNTRTKRWTKIDTKHNRILGSKRTPYKGIRKK